MGKDEKPPLSEEWNDEKKQTVNVGLVTKNWYDYVYCYGIPGKRVLYQWCRYASYWCRYASYHWYRWQVRS
jgi:hypothetical protein